MDTNITKKFIKYKIPENLNNQKMEDYCMPKKFTLQQQQNFLPDFLSSSLSSFNDDNIRGILIYHQIGSGKTCTAITIAEKFKHKKKIIIVLPASLTENFIDEIISECTGNEYISQNERILLTKYKLGETKYDNIIEKTKKKINKYYTIYSYHKFVNLINMNKIKLNNTLLIIDEIQNMISINGIFYKSLLNIITKSNNTLKIILLSATPMFDKPIEIGLTLNLLKINDPFIINKFNQDYITKSGNNYKTINLKHFKLKLNNLVSYYRGAPPQTYPKMIFKTVKCSMSNFQYKSYLSSLSSDSNNVTGSFKNVDILNMPQNFFLGPRMVSNIAFPNKSIGDIGFSSFKSDILLIKNIKKYSIKFYKIYKKIIKSIGNIFIYSNFKDNGGIKCFITFLEYHGWKNYITYGEGPKRFAIWSGDENNIIKNEIKYIFNQKSNENGSKIKLIFGTPSIKEGVTLLRIEQVHILEPYWNISRIQQILGRAVRFCSHKDVPKNRRYVNVYLYLSVIPYKNNNKLNEKSIDQYIWSIAKKKNKLIEDFEIALKESAFDCNLFYNRNVYKNDEYKLICKK
jgi:superfamily II DNA or RNA helicase